MKSILYTIGHSTRFWEELLELLREYDIKHLIDIRTIPRSRRMPWFNLENLSKSLPENKIQYTHMAQLGGLRKPLKNSINQGWKNTSFRGFADYMQTDRFHLALEELNKLINQKKCTIMCAEAVPWRCHRSLIADAEVALGIEVEHIIHKTNLKKHEMTSFAKISNKSNKIQVYYPNPYEQLNLFE